MFLGLLLSFAFYFHDFHFSFTILDYSEEEKMVKCSQKVFYDDLELALQKYYDRDLRLDTIVNTAGDSLLMNYFVDNLFLSGNKEIDVEWVGSEMQGPDLIWMYVQFDGKRLPKELTIKSKLFTELYDDQANIILLKNMPYDDDRLHLDNTDKSATIFKK